jgi:hypothetical protein
VSTAFEEVIEIVRRALERGQRVEIDGLGVFDGGHFQPESRPNVFLAYVDEDREAVRKVRDALIEAGFHAWLDKDQLLAGQNWPRAIERAIGVADAFVPCFSTRAVAKRGTFQSELRYALDCARHRPLDDIYFVPVRFEACTLPPQVTDQTQYVDLFPDWQRGMRRLVRALGRVSVGGFSLRRPSR